MQPKCTYDLETQADTDAIYLLERQTVSPVSEFWIQSFAAAQQIVAELLQYAACLEERRDEETWK